MDLDFLNTILENVFTPLYGLALGFALWQYPRYFDTPLKYFPILLMYTFLNELLGYVIKYSEKYSFVWSDLYSDYNVVIYNIYNIIFFLYFFYVFHSSLKHKKFRNFIAVGTIIFVFIAFLNPFIQNFILESQFYTYLAGTLLLICAILFYFKELREVYTTKFPRRNLLFWIGTGMFIFYLCYLPIKVLRYYNSLTGTDEAPFIRKIHLILILVMYSCFIVGFFYTRKRKYA